MFDRAEADRPWHDTCSISNPGEAYLQHFDCAPVAQVPMPVWEWRDARFRGFSESYCRFVSEVDIVQRHDKRGSRSQHFTSC